MVVGNRDRTLFRYRKNGQPYDDRPNMEIETLIARGRRVRRPKEQREVAFSFAELSTRQNSHVKLVKKGCCKALIHLITKSTDNEAQRYACLCLANISSTPENHQIIPVSGVIPVLLDYIVLEAGDTFGKGYSALALGNLVADPVNHEEVVKLNGIERLISLLRHENPYCGRFSAFALGNLAVHADNRAEIVEKDGIPLLIELACFVSRSPLGDKGGDDVAPSETKYFLSPEEERKVQKAALGAIRSLCIEPELRELVVKYGGIDPLIILEKDVNDPDLRYEVACAFNCLSSVEHNKFELCDRSLSTILSLALSDDVRLEQQAICALANFLEDSSLHEPIVAENGIPVIISLACSDDEINQAEAVRCLAHLSASRSTTPELVLPQEEQPEETYRYQQLIFQGGGLNPIIRVIAGATKSGRRYSALTVGNFSANLQFQTKLMELGAAENLVELANDGEAEMEAVRYACFAIGMTCQPFHDPF